VNRAVALLSTCCLVLGHTPTCAQPRGAETVRPYRLRWDDLPPLVTGARVALELHGGVRVQGRVLSVEPNGWTLQITKTSDPQLCGKGRQWLPRSAIRQMKLSKTRGIAGRVIGTTIGLCFGLVPGIGLAAGAILEGAYWGPVIAGIMILPPTLGYFLGRAADRREMLITVEPAPGGSAKAALP
jgi:hypothetical protein